MTALTKQEKEQFEYLIGNHNDDQLSLIRTTINGHDVAAVGLVQHQQDEVFIYPVAVLMNDYLFSLVTDPTQPPIEDGPTILGEHDSLTSQQYDPYLIRVDVTDLDGNKHRVIVNIGHSVGVIRTEYDKLAIVGEEILEWAVWSDEIEDIDSIANWDYVDGDGEQYFPEEEESNE